MMDLLDIFGIIAFIIMLVLCFGGSFYIFLTFSNKDEKDTPGIKLIRIQIIISLGILLFLPITLLMDFLTQAKIKGLDFYFNFDLADFPRYCFLISTFVVMVNQCILNFYSNKKKELKSRIISTLIFTGVLILIYCTSVYIVHNVFKNIDNGATVITVQVANFIKSESNRHYMKPPKIEKLIISENITFMSSLCIPLLVLSVFFYSIFAGSAFGFFPLKLIDSYFYGATLPDPEDHVLAKRYLFEETKNIVEKGKTVYALRHEVMITEEDDPKLDLKKDILKTKVLEMKENVYEYKKICDYYNDVENILEKNPLMDLGILILGIISIIISILLISHAILSIKDKNIIMETFFGTIFDQSSIFAYITLLLISYYVIISVVFSAFQFSTMFSFLDFYPIEINKTWTDTFLKSLNIGILSYLGFLGNINKSVPIFFSFLRYNLFFIRFLQNIRYIRELFRYKFGNYSFILFFCIAVFISFFMKKGKILLKEKVIKAKKEINKQRLLMEEAKNPKTTK